MLDCLMKSMKVIDLNSKENLYQAGDSADYFYLILKGGISLTGSEEGR